MRAAGREWKCLQLPAIMAERRSAPFRPAHAFPVGHHVAELAKVRGLDIPALARRMGVASDRVVELLEGRIPLPVDQALILEKVLNVSAHYWINLEGQYLESMARSAEIERLTGCEPWIRHFPYREMAQLGWIPREEKGWEWVRALLEFFGVAGVDQWDEVYGNTPGGVAEPGKRDGGWWSLSCWLRRAVLIESDNRLPPFEMGRFVSHMGAMRALAEASVERVQAGLATLCEDAGVGFVVLPGLPRLRAAAGLVGAGNVPIVAISQRQSSPEAFWLAFFQVARRLLDCGASAPWVVGPEGISEDVGSLAFAREMLWDEGTWGRFVAGGEFLRASIVDAARLQRLTPGMIVARLQRENLLPLRTRLNSLKHPFVFNLHQGEEPGGRA